MHRCNRLSLVFPAQVANEIRYALDRYTNPVPAVLEIPSKDLPYDPSKDSILTRAKVHTT
jgi:V-type H+-transporting ATPase subunit F